MKEFIFDRLFLFNLEGALATEVTEITEETAELYLKKNVNA